MKETLYDKVFTALFLSKIEAAENSNVEELSFTTDELVNAANDLNVQIKNIPDIIYSYRSRCALPASIETTGNWMVIPKGKGKFAFKKMNRPPFVEIPKGFLITEIPNALPEIVEKYVADDEQGLLSAIRYNRLLDIFTELTCFHLQSHIRTTIESEGQIEIDDLYVGLDQNGIEYILPFEAKSSSDRDKLGWFQIANLVKYAHQNFSQLKCRPICAKPVDKNTVYLLEFDDNPDCETVAIKNIKLYRLIREPVNLLRF